MLTEITGLWLTEDSHSGKKRMTGKIGKMSVIVVKNKFKKEGSNQPDYKLMAIISEKERQDEG